MSKSLLEQLPGIVAAGKRQAAQILEQLEGRNRVSLQTRELVIPSRDTVAGNLFGQPRVQSGDVAPSINQPNRLIYGDNLLAMAALLAGDEVSPSARGKVDMIYIDPPFDSKADYRTKILLPGTTIDQKPNVLEQVAYSDTWTDGTASYLAMIVPRLVLMRELLTDTGSIWVHLDWHVGHYVKIVLDELFGKDNFVNEVIWHYKSFHGQTKAYFPRKHDVLFLYGKTNKRYFKLPRKDIPVEDMTDFKNWGKYIVNEDEIRGDNYPSDVRFKRNVDKWSRENPGREPGPDDVLYLFRAQPEDDTWDIPYLDPKDKKERVNYDTQKPEALLDRIIESTAPENGLVADFFVGSGTLAASAEKLGRRWIVGDLGKPAAMITRKRMIDQGAGPFLYQAIGDYQVEQARSTLGRSFRVGHLARVVLELYGALPLPPEDNVNATLGRLPSSRTLVFADSPSKLTTIATLRRAQGYRDSKMGGFDKVVVLGWNFSAGIGRDIANLQDSNLEVLVIPPDLLDRLKKKGVDKLASGVRFASLQYLEATVASRKQTGDGEQLRAVLQNYVLLSPEALNLDEKNRDALRAVMNGDPLALIEYWAVDPDYDGEIFRSVWQDYRGNTENNHDPLRVVTTAQLQVPRLDGSRRVCIRAVDVFGFESEVVIDGVDIHS